MSGYRLGQIHIEDAHAGALDLEGDGFAAAGETVTLLPNAAVARYLGLSDEEARQAREIVASYRSALTRLYSASNSWVPPTLDERARSAQADLATAVAALLGAERTARLNALSWRVRDGFALVDAEVATRLGLTAAQRSAIAAAAADEEQNNQRVLRNQPGGRPRSDGRGRPTSHQPIEDAGRDFVRRGSERILSLLTPEQRQRFDAMKRGAP